MCFVHPVTKQNFLTVEGYEFGPNTPVHGSSADQYIQLIEIPFCCYNISQEPLQWSLHRHTFFYSYEQNWNVPFFDIHNCKKALCNLGLSSTDLLSIAE